MTCIFEQYSQEHNKASDYLRALVLSCMDYSFVVQDRYKSEVAKVEQDRYERDGRYSRDRDYDRRDREYDRHRAGRSGGRPAVMEKDSDTDKADFSTEHLQARTSLRMIQHSLRSEHLWSQGQEKTTIRTMMAVKETADRNFILRMNQFLNSYLLLSKFYLEGEVSQQEYADSLQDLNNDYKVKE